VQLTPPGSPASIQFGEGPTAMKNGPLQGLFLVVDDIEAAREDLIRRGAEVSEIWHAEPSKGPVQGLDPQRRSYSSRGKRRRSATTSRRRIRKRSTSTCSTSACARGRIT